jgi:arylsulfatase A-like enzyme
VRTLPVVAVTATASLLAWALAFALAWPWHRGRRERALPLAIALAALLAALALPGLVACYRGQEPEIATWLRFAPLGVALAVGAFVLVRRNIARASDPLVRWIALAAPLAAAQLSLLVWVSTRLAAGSAPARALALAGFLAAVAASLILAWRARAHLPAPALLGIAFAVSCAPGLADLVPRTPGAARASGSAPSRSVRRIVLVVVDTLRADRLSCYSREAPPTPHIDALAAEGIVFDAARASAPFTLPSVCTILTGVPPTVHRVRDPTDALPRGLTTLAERLREGGYRTAAFVRNPWLRPVADFDRGFEEFHFLSWERPPSALAEILLRRLWSEVYRPVARGGEQARLARRWIERHRDEDFFLWLHFLDPHAPYAPPPELVPPGQPPPRIGRSFRDAAAVRTGNLVPDLDERAWIEGLYGGEVRYLDACVGEVTAEMKRLGIYDDALIVLTSDHGEEFWEHGGFEHGQSMFDELLRVPLILRLPRAALVERVGAPVSHQSLAPTLLSLCGIEYDPEEFPLPPLLRDLDRPEVSVPAEPLLSSMTLYFEDRTAVVFDGWKYVRHAITGREELYDLGRDPRETRELSSEAPERLREAREVLARELARAEALRSRLELEAASAPVDEGTRRGLRALGYAK